MHYVGIYFIFNLESSYWFSGPLHRKYFDTYTKLPNNNIKIGLIYNLLLHIIIVWFHFTIIVRLYYLILSSRIV